MRIVKKPVEGGVRVSRVANYLMPFLHGELTGDDRRPAAISFLQDFEKIMPGHCIKRLQSPIIENQKINAPERTQQARMAAVSPC